MLCLEEYLQDIMKYNILNKTCGEQYVLKTKQSKFANYQLLD